LGSVFAVRDRILIEDEFLHVRNNRRHRAGRGYGDLVRVIRIIVEDLVPEHDDEDKKAARRASRIF